MLLKNLRLIAPKHPSNGEEVDILIQEGVIQRIKKGIRASKDIPRFDAKGACVSIGWVDVGTQVCEPGFEHREDLQSVSEAALRGGFSTLAAQPNTHPVIQSKSEVHYIIRNSADLPVQIHPIGAVSHDCKGGDLTELYDMHQAGAIAFSDGKYSIQDAGLMLRSLQYVKAFDGVIINQPHTTAIAGEGQMHDGYWSTMLGTRGIPDLAEVLMVKRDIDLAKYTDSRLHIANISVAESVDLVRQAKKDGLKVTCSVAIANLIFEDKELSNFDENFKVFPPLRTEKDRRSLQKGLKDGTIDFIVTNHVPWDKEAKDLEFAYSKFGMIGLETCFALANTHLSKILSTEQLVNKLAYQARAIFGLEIPKIAVGEKACLTIFDPQKEWTLETSDLGSKSRNTPFVGTTFTGKVLGMMQGEVVHGLVESKALV